MGIPSDISYIPFLCFLFLIISLPLCLSCSFLSPILCFSLISSLLSFPIYLVIYLSIFHCRRMTYFSVTASLRIAEELWHPRGRRTRSADVLCHLHITVQYYIRYIRYFAKNSTAYIKPFLLTQSIPLSQPACFCYSLTPVTIWSTTSSLLNFTLHAKFSLLFNSSIFLG